MATPTTETRRAPSEELPARHVDKKPRLDTQDGEAALPEAEAHQLDAPADVQMEGTGGKTAKAQKPAKKKGAGKGKRNKHWQVLPDHCSPEDVIYRDVLALLGEDAVQKATEEGTDWASPFKLHDELELVVRELSPTGESLSVAPSPHPPWVILTPFALPGETIRVRVYRSSRLHSHADLLEVITPNTEMRDMSRVKCKYFGQCAGCQYQMLSYDTQLDLKRNVVAKAYKNYSDLSPATIPEILPTIGSPLQYGYRTKLTPHFDDPSRMLKRKGAGEAGAGPDWLKIGFNKIGTRNAMDIEECPIGTPVLNEAYGPLRKHIAENIHTYKRGVSLLLRESLEIPSSTSKADTTDVELADAMEKKVCITNHKEVVRERVGDMLFDYSATSFFQNNNSVLVPLTSYVRDAIFPPGQPSSPFGPTHLVDAYCGSGLFAITLSPYFKKITGIELSTESIRYAKENMKLNNLTDDKCSFLEGDAANIFDVVQEFPRNETVLIIDPPRKGSDEKFINQLVEFGCSTVVYVSCNVHTQARDVGMILRKSKEAREKLGGREYVMESLRGFDLFPQTAHVESVAVLKLVEVPASS